MQAPAVFSILLNLDKKIIRVLQNDFHSHPPINPESSFYNLFDASLKPELESFWQQLILHGAISGYSINAISDNSSNSYCFNAIVQQELVWMIVCKSSDLANENFTSSQVHSSHLLSPEEIPIQQENKIISEGEIFNSDVAHALEEPIRMITGFMTLLKSRYVGSLDEKAGSFFDFAIDGGRRLQKMIVELIAFAAIGKKNQAKEPVDLHSLLQEVLQSMNHQITQYHAQILLPDSGTKLYGYRSELVKLFQHLLDNAIKFRQKDCHPRITIDCLHHAHAITITISDNGIGIPEYAHETIFSAFKKLHGSAAYQGHGLGLTFCKKIIDLHGGSIKVESQQGEGSRFQIQIPAVVANN
jgi:light-regulated signal transduction histidine kinase (bacteriophytochrome)